MIHEPLIPNDVAKAEDVNRELVKLYNHANNPGTLTADEIVVTGNVKAGGFVLNGAAVDGGWTPGLTLPSTIENLGNGSQKLTWTGSDQTGTLSAGMRLQGTRGTATQTQVAELDGASSYLSKSSPTGFSAGAQATILSYIDPSEYPSSTAEIVNRRSGDDYWLQRLLTDGRIGFYTRDGSATSDSIISTATMPLAPSSIATAIDVSGNTGKIIINGTRVDSAYTVGTTSTIGQSGDLTIGRRPDSASGFLPARVAHVAYFNTVLSDELIREYQANGLTGSEPNLVWGTYLDGDAIDIKGSNDLTETSVTYVDGSPYGNGLGGLLDYAIISKIDLVGADTVAYIQTPTGSIFPESGLSALAYSIHNAYRFPSEKEKWVIEAVYRGTFTDSTASTSYETTPYTLKVPIGPWDVRASTAARLETTTTSMKAMDVTLSADASSQTHIKLTATIYSDNASNATANHGGSISVEDTITLDIETEFTLMSRISNATGVGSRSLGYLTKAPSIVKAEYGLL